MKRHHHTIFRNTLTVLLAAGALGALAGGSMAWSAHAVEPTVSQEAADGIEKMDRKDQKLVEEGVDSSDRALEKNRASRDDGNFILEQQPSQKLAHGIIGLDLIDRGGDQDRSIGAISDLVLNGDDELAGVLVGVGGFLGMGTKDVAIPWARLESLDIENGVAYVSISKQELKDAPQFQSTEGGKLDALKQELKERQQQSAPRGSALMPSPAPQK